MKNVQNNRIDMYLCKDNWLLIIFEYKVPADVVAVDSDLAVSALLLAAVQQRLLLVQALVVVGDLPHL